MQQIHLMNNNILLESKLKGKMGCTTSAVRKGKKRVVGRFFRKFADKFHKRKKNWRRRMEKRVVSLASRTNLSTRSRIPKKHFIIHIQSTYNNTIYSLSQKGGKTEKCVSTGMCGFKNARKSTSYAAQITAEKVGIIAKKYKKVSVKIKGLGPGKVNGVKALNRTKVKIQKIWESSALPHNGCRPAKRRRL